MEPSRCITVQSKSGTSSSSANSSVMRPGARALSVSSTARLHRVNVRACPQRLHQTGAGAGIVDAHQVDLVKCKVAHVTAPFPRSVSGRSSRCRLRTAFSASQGWRVFRRIFSAHRLLGTALSRLRWTACASSAENGRAGLRLFLQLRDCLRRPLLMSRRSYRNHPPSPSPRF